MFGMLTVEEPELQAADNKVTSAIRHKRTLVLIMILCGILAPCRAVAKFNFVRLYYNKAGPKKYHRPDRTGPAGRNTLAISSW